MNKLINLNSPYIKSVLPILLKDRTTKRNIIWATDNYANKGENFYEISEITEDALSILGDDDFQPRVYKSQLTQKSRTKTKAEVFTPVWICNLMNSHCDEIWFGYKDVFNKPSEDNKKWIKTRKVVFPDDKNWKDYVDSRRIEITCGEAPYLVSRYDTTTGAIIPIGKRIGMLDRKLRVIDENAETKDEWFFWVVRAYQATYGYEWQGDNLLIARINLLLSFIEYMKNKWNEEPTEKELEKIAIIISWNIWQMDGLKNTTICNQELEKKIVERKINDYNNKLFRLQNLKFEIRVLTENVIVLAELNQDLISGTRYTPKQFAKIIVDCNYLYGLAVSLTNYSTVKIKNEKKVIEDLCKRRDKLIAKYTKEKENWTNYQLTEPMFCKIRKWAKRADGELQGPSIEFRELREEKYMGKDKKKLFDYSLGNPPYQGDNHKQLYPDFYIAAKEIANVVDMIFPVGWQAPKNALNLQKMNTQEIKEDKQIILIDNRQNVFVGVQGAEWTNIILWRHGYDNKLNGKQLIYTDGANPEVKQLFWDKNNLESLPDELKQITSHFTKDEQNNLPSIMYSGRSVLKFTEEFLKDYPNSPKTRLEAIQKKQPNTTKLGPNEEYELKTSTFEVLEEVFVKDDPQDNEKYYKLYGSYDNKRTIRWILKKYMEPRYKEKHNVNCYKVLIAKAASAGDFGAKLSDTIIAAPNESCTPTFYGIGYFDTLIEAQNCTKYIKTKLFRALLGVLKTTRDNPAPVFAYIPIQNFTENSDIDWSKSVAEIDQQLYKKYNLSPKEIAFIEEKVKEME